jgi:ribosomal protein S2
MQVLKVQRPGLTTMKEKKILIWKERKNGNILDLRLTSLFQAEKNKAEQKKINLFSKIGLKWTKSQIIWDACFACNDLHYQGRWIVTNNDRILND